MKMKLILAVAAASALLLSSCRKADEVTPSESQFDELEFTATIEGPSTKTTVNTDGGDIENRGKIEWVAGDEIKIKDAVGTEVTYVATNSGTTSTFRKKSGQNARLGSGSYTATYGTAPSTTQNYADHYKDATHAQNVYMTAKAETRSLTFTAACGLLKLTLTAEDYAKESITKIEVSGKVNGTDATYTLNCVKEDGTAVSISSATDFYLTLPAGSYYKMVFYNASDKTCTRHPYSPMAIADNKIQPVTIDNLFRSPLLPGEFSVSASKKVKFTSGNLWWCGSTWHLETSQNAYPSAWNTRHVGHFLWTNLCDYQSGKAVYMPYASSYSCGDRSISDKFFCGEDNPMTVDGQGDLYALTNVEWNYLLFTRKVKGNSGDGYTYKNCVKMDDDNVGVVIGGVTYKGLFIFPDGYTGETEDMSQYADFTAIEATGIIFLSAAGFRDGIKNGSDPGNVGSYGYYWSATPRESREDLAYGLLFNSSRVDPDSYDGRTYGLSVRLVGSVSK